MPILTPQMNPINPSDARPSRQVLLLTVGFLISMAIRVAIGGASVAASAPAGIIFAVCLIALAYPLRTPTKPTVKIMLWGLLGAVILFVPIALLHASSGLDHARPAGNYAAWALIVSFVAVAEELFLRGKLYDAVASWRSSGWAIVLGAVLFTVLHIPLYGFHVVQLDFAVGLLLGSLRSVTNSWIAPGITHVLADLGAWWII